MYLGHEGWIYKSEPDFYYPKPYQYVYVIYEKDVVYAAIYHPNGFWIIDDSEIDDDKIIAWRSKSC